MKAMSYSISMGVNSNPCTNILAKVRTDFATADLNDIA
jgi:hypothetical protein